MIRFSAAEGWFEGLDAAKLSEAILTGIGDATSKGIELVNQTIHAKLISTSEHGAPEAYDPVTGNKIPMVARIMLRVERDPMTVDEYARCERVAQEQKTKKDARDEKTALATAKAQDDVKQSFLQGVTLQITQKAEKIEAVPAPVKLADQLREAADLLTVVREITAPAKALAQ